MLAERNKSRELGNLTVIEASKVEAGNFATPMGGFHYHDAAFAELFQLPVIRAYSMILAAGGRTEKHEERFDRRLFAITHLKLREDIDGQPSSGFL